MMKSICLHEHVFLTCIYRAKYKYTICVLQDDKNKVEAVPVGSQEVRFWIDSLHE